jgi:hypothetical protein
MNTLYKLSVAFALASISTLSVNAQFITWSGPTNISGPSDIATNGVYVDALQTHGGYSNFAPLEAISVTNPTTGVATEFNIYTSSGSTGGSPANFYSDGTFTLTADSDTGADGSGSDATPYQQILDEVTYAFTPEVGTVTMSGLTMGDEYQVQVWASAGGRPTTYSSGANTVDANFVPNGTGQYVIGTFTATGATQTFNYQNSYPIDVSAGEINALSLRDLSVPEPSTYAMLFAGLGALALVSRLRRLA